MDFEKFSRAFGEGEIGIMIEEFNTLTNAMKTAERKDRPILTKKLLEIKKMKEHFSGFKEADQIWELMDKMVDQPELLKI